MLVGTFASQQNKNVSINQRRGQQPHWHWATRPPSFDLFQTHETMAQVPNDNHNEQPVALIETPGNAPPIDILEIADPPRQMKIEVSI